MMMTYFYNDIQRLDWGFGNPNTTAALIAMLAVGALGAGLVWKKLFWIALPVTAGLLLALIHTLSRGGMLAFVGGIIILVIALRPKLPSLRMAALFIVAIGAIAYAYHLGGAARYIQSIHGAEDRSVTNRWLIYRSFPRMLAAAPGGWGNGNAAAAYHQWYQPAGRSEDYLNLVSSHCTWLVEWPTWSRLLYVLSWAVAFLLTWPKGNHKWWSVPNAVLATLFIAACFSSVAHRLWIWPLPAALLLLVLAQRFIWLRDFPKPRVIALTLFAAGGAYSALLLLAFVPNESPKITHQNGVTTVGSLEAPSRISIYGSDQSILGKRLGHRLRDFVQAHPHRSISLLDSLRKLDPSTNFLVLVGSTSDQLKHSNATASIVLLNPSRPTAAIDLKNHSIQILNGEFNATGARYYWEPLAKRSNNIDFKSIQGQGLYLESWLNEISYE